ncbi:MAG: acyl carrier protein [Christensenella sp.]
MTDLLPAVATLLAEYSTAEPEDITPDKHLVSDLELDSFSLLDAMTAFEDEFGISIPDRDLKLLDTVGDVIDYIEAHPDL